MLQRSRSATFVVIAGIVPAILGGPIFAAAFTAIMLATFHEFISMCGFDTSPLARFGYMAIVAFGATPLLTNNAALFRAVLAFAALAPLVRALLLPVDFNRLSEWAIVSGGALYMGLPTFAAIDLRLHTGASSQAWVNDLADILNPNSVQTGAGLGLFLFALLVIWLSDTFAYLVGRQIGRTKLIPHISPNKTVEGALGGLTAASVTGFLCVSFLGMEISPAAGFALGAAVAIVGMVGDLVESMIKRQVGVKDSGTLIPGHGGVFDRVDALMYGVLTVWITVPLVM